MIYKKTYYFVKIEDWAGEISKAAGDFKKNFECYPHIFLANPITYSNLNLEYNKQLENVDENGNPVPGREFLGLQGFNSDEFSAEFFVDSLEKDNQYSLVFDTDYTQLQSSGQTEP